MTTVKSQTKGTATEKKEKVWQQDELHAAYELHTLCQMIYAEIATTHPWAPPISPIDAFATMTPPSIHLGAVPPWTVPNAW